MEIDASLLEAIIRQRQMPELVFSIRRLLLAAQLKASTLSDWARLTLDRLRSLRGP
jgi:hypothetical protein